MENLGSNNSGGEAPSTENVSQDTNTPVNTGTDGASQNTTPGGQPQEQTPPPSQSIKTITYKVNGKEYTEELPFEVPNNPEVLEYVRKQIQLAKNSTFTTQQAKDVLKAAQAERDSYKALFEKGKGSFKDVAKHFGWSQDDVIQYYAEQQAFEALPPELKRLYELEQKEQARIIEAENAKTAQEQALQKQREQEATIQFSNELLEQIKQDGLLEGFDPNNVNDFAGRDYVIGMVEGVGKVIEEAYEAGIELTVQEAKEEFLAREYERFGSFVKSASNQELIKMIGKERFENLKKEALQEAINSTSVRNQNSRQSGQVVRNEPSQTKLPSVDHSDWLKRR